MDGATLLTLLDSLPWLDGWRVSLYSADDFARGHAEEEYPTSRGGGRDTLVVLNTGYSSGPGEHYVSWAVRKDRAGVVYFDSYGIEPYPQLRDHWKRHGLSPVRYNSDLLQSPFSNTCSLYQLTFAAFVSVGVDFGRFLSLFSRDVDVNERRIRDFVREYLLPRAD